MKKTLLISLTALAFTRLTLNAQTGVLDNSFNSTGRLDYSISSAQDYGTGCVIQPDGKIVAVGGFINGQFDTGVLRLNPNGTFDNTFGAAGVFTVNIAGTDRANSVALQPDGKIIVAGNNSDDFCVARLNTNGTLDNTFNSTGTATIDIGGGDECLKVLLQSDGKIIMIGRGIISFYNKIEVIRLNANGTLDNTFDGDGKATYTVSNVADLGISGAVQPDGKIIITGYSTLSGSGHDYTAMRINSNGSWDTSFGTNGWIRVPVGAGTANDYTYDMALYPDGRIIMVGNNGLVRLNSNGTLDNTFDGDGILNFVAPIRSVILQPDGKIVCGAYSTVYRFNANGTTDNSFGTSGMASAPSSYNSAYLSDVQLQADGKIVTVSHNDMLFGPSNSEFLICRFTGDPGTGIETLGSGANELLVYPNPATDVVNVKITAEKNGAIIVTDMLGNKVFEQAYSKDDSNLSISTRELANGLYFANYGAASVKFVVSK